MTTRQQKINSLIKQEISRFLAEEKFDGITGLLTIMGVDTTADLEQAKVFFSVVGQDVEAAAAVLKRHIYEIQGMLNRKLNLRKVPRIYFVSDTSGEYAAYISQIIHNINDSDNS